MSNALKIIQVGVGFWGWSWVNVVLESPSWELVGLVDLKRENLKKACDYYKLRQEKTFTSIRAAVESVKPDAALIVVGADAHAQVTVNALNQGLHCLVEKPIAPTMKEARSIVDTALKVNRKLMVSQNYRYKRAPRTIKEFLNSGMMGEVGSVFVNFQKAPYFTGFTTS